MLKHLFIIIVLLLTSAYLNAKETLTIGVYENAPKIFLNEKNTPSGFFVDILNEIAKKENWNLEYVPCEWSECLKMLETSKLDIMPDVAHTPEREKKFLFCNETILSSWSILYRNSKVKIESNFDLKGKRIAILKDTIQSFSIRDLLEKFDITPKAYIDTKDYKTAFSLLSKGDVDCVITNRFYELNHTLGANVVKTDLVFEPMIMKYAFSPSRSDLVNKLDYHIKEFKKNNESIFYTAKNKWLIPKKSSEIPKWILWSLAISIIASTVLLLLVMLFKNMVTKASKDLLQKEKIILVQSKQASMGEMISLIAHQWRQPLSIMSMSANNMILSIELEENITNQEIMDTVQTIAEQVQYLSNTIDDFKNFFKPTKTQNQTKISYVIEKIEKIYGNSFQRNNIEFKKNYESDYEINISISELLQVLLNILNNARDILKEKEEIHSKIVLTTSEDKDNFFIEICDNGGGIPESIINKIGTQYFTTKGQNGTGLGLYMSKKIVEEHLNGTLNWKNTHNGTCFTISISK